MVDWDRVADLRSKGWDWDEIADDPKVGFHPDASVREPGRALRALYHRQRSRQDRQGPAPLAPPKRRNPDAERRWTVIRFLYLLVPLVGVWGGIAYGAPSPVGILVPAIPYLLIALAVAAVLLIYLLLRTNRRWTPIYRSTLIGGVVLGLIWAGMIGLVGALVFGCPYLPPAAALGPAGSGPGWSYSGSITPWHEDGKVVVFFYGATWCPYCSASSWSIWKALRAFGSVSGQVYQYSSPTDVYAQTPEVNLANAGVSSNSITFIVDEYNGGVDGTFPGTTDCYQQAYVTAYSGGAIPFVVINGQYIHGGSSLNDPADLSDYSYSQDQNGTGTVAGQVIAESGSAWDVVDTQAYWMIAYIAKATGVPIGTLSSEYAWSSGLTSTVTSYYDQL